ncbi:hypothetical protein DFQ11_1121 [Winogradskyella epiphytica]|uniref:Aspartyl protease n=1 Tax=Winogradskyella epiphytica TaxID=262005 RepID=A0A2V4XFI8_9FLAO|nr:hypothetical protein [Winogradskyella epiphytica]PYE79255.1 hypothetical protein DFQ11_1121 [Winogradskyella epiphytica]GGW74554.1 hypothetical protein GCM10008085_28350 [Winogradskyella epiphytica]
MSDKEIEIRLDLKIDEHGFFYTNMDISKNDLSKTAYNCKVIIDTGASTSLIKPHLAENINIIRYGETNISNPLSLERERTNAYEVNLSNDLIMIPKLKCIEMKDLLYPADFLIGINVIKHYDFHWDSLNKNAYMVFRNKNHDV